MLRILRVCPAPFHLTAFRKKHSLFRAPFERQMEAYRRENILLPGGWARAMENENFTVMEVLYNDAVSQSKWASENGHGGLVMRADYPYYIFQEQVKSFAPDIILFYAGANLFFPPDRREHLRTILGKPILIASFWGDELPSAVTYREFFKGTDIVFCSSSAYLKKLRAADVVAQNIGNCFDDSIIPAPSYRRKHNLVFCGTTGYGFEDHIGRYEKLVELLKSRRDLEVWANEPRGINRLSAREAALYVGSRLPRISLRAAQLLIPFSRPRRLAQLSMLVKETGVHPRSILRGRRPHPRSDYFLGRKSVRRMFGSRIQRLVPDCSEYYAIIANSSMVLNLHRDEEADIGNIRCYEATGLGACLLTDHGTGLKEFFDTENEIVTFESVKECIDKIEFLMAHPDEMRRIAANGQRATLERHTVAVRCAEMASTIRDMIGDATMPRNRASGTIEATYDLDGHPLSYDFAFFLEAAEIYKKNRRADRLTVRLLWPRDLTAMPGVSEAADAAVDSESRAFRIHHVCSQLAQLKGVDCFSEVRDRRAVPVDAAVDGGEQMTFPPIADHHTQYYRTVNANPGSVTGFSASVQAHRYIQKWLDRVGVTRKIVCVTLRQYGFDTQRNSNIREWDAFLRRLDHREFAVVVVPDTDHVAEFLESPLARYPFFESAGFDVDLRFALYEKAYLNMWVNTGPGVAATLNPRIRYLMFKILVDDVGHCSPEFLEMSGFKIGRTPEYASRFQKWVWKDDTRDVLQSEFEEMDAVIRASGCG
jgi:hypothetical protein